MIATRIGMGSEKVFERKVRGTKLNIFSANCLKQIFEIMKIRRERK